MPDPRIQRTHNHVLEVARRILTEHDGEPLTFTRLAREAQVSRRTLYVHWGTIERVLSEAATQDFELSSDDAQDSARARLERFVRGIRDGIAEPVANAAMSSLLSLATHDGAAVDSLVEIAEGRLSRFRDLVAPISDDQYAELIGPIYFTQFISRQPISEELIQSIVDKAALILGLDDDPAPIGEAA